MLHWLVPCVVLLASVCQCYGLKSYDGWSLIKAWPRNDTHLAYLNNLGKNDTSDQVEIWFRGNLRRPFDIFVSPEAKTSILAKLDELGIEYEITSENVQISMEAERAFVPIRPRTMSQISNPELFSKYLNLEEINLAIQKMANDYPEIVRTESIGKTHEGRPIMLVTVSSNSTTDSKPGIWIDGGIHAREWISPATTLFILNKLVTKYSTNANISNYVDQATFYIVPVLNPDGYHYTFETDRMWRKNRRPKACTLFFCCNGVDLNRNFDHQFGGPGTSDDACEEDYHGPSAFSEPESRAVRDFLKSHKDIKAFVNLHAYSQMWFYPYASPANSYPPDVKELEAVAKRCTSALESKYGTVYEVGSPADLIYEAAGGSIDWAKSEGVKYSYALELRPNGTYAGPGFILPPNQIVPTGEETFAGLSVLFDVVTGNSSP